MEYNGKKLFAEAGDGGCEYRKRYLESVEKFVRKSLDEADVQRKRVMTPERFASQREELRGQYFEVMGIPKNCGGVPEAASDFVGEDDMCRIYRLSLRVMEDFCYYGILFVPHGIEKAPLVIAQHGGGGTPESCSDIHGENNYDNFTKRALERGFVVFAPQLLVWCFNVETGEKFKDYKIEYNRGEIDFNLKQCGMSIAGLEIFCIMRSIDYLVSLEYVNEDKIGMMGLSYGGFFSLYTAAADTRIKAVYSAAAFNDKSHVSLTDWACKNSAYTFHDAEAAGLCAPRRIFVDVGKADIVFDYKYAAEEAERAKEFYNAAGAGDSFRFNLWEGEHRFDTGGGGFDFFFESLA